MKTCSSSHLRRSAAFILILHSFTALSQIDHEIKYLVGCFKDGPTQVHYELDSEEMVYADFDNSSVVFTVPAFFMFDPTMIFEEDHLFVNAKKGRRTCSALMTYLVAEEKHPPENKEPPESAVYPAEEVKFGSENTLICFVNHFFPPAIKVNWTKNDQPVTEGVSISRYYPNSDLTFHQFSTLTFTPSKGDIYTCTVEHVALESPKTRIWESDIVHESQSVLLDIYCGVGLALGFVGVAIGTFCFVKGLN